MAHESWTDTRVRPLVWLSPLTWPACFMQLRRESAENGDFSGPKGEFKNRFSGRNRIEIPSGPNFGFWTEKAPLSALAVAGFMKYAG